MPCTDIHLFVVERPHTDLDTMCVLRGSAIDALDFSIACILLVS